MYPEIVQHTLMLGHRFFYFHNKFTGLIKLEGNYKQDLEKYKSTGLDKILLGDFSKYENENEGWEEESRKRKK